MAENFEVNRPAMGEVSEWVNQFKIFWTRKLDALENFLHNESMKTGKRKSIKKKKMTDTPLTIERVLNAPVNKVWKAITDVNEMAQWYFKLDNFKPEVGFEFRFYGGTEEKQYLHICEVTEVVPQKKLTYSWRYDGYPGISFVTFELFAEGAATIIKLTHTGLESFPSATDPNFAVKSFTEGWTFIIGKSLKEYVEREGYAS